MNERTFKYSKVRRFCYMVAGRSIVLFVIVMLLCCPPLYILMLTLLLQWIFDKKWDF